jgi:hypothetical protein
VSGFVNSDYWAVCFSSLGEALQPDDPLQPPPANGILPDKVKRKYVIVNDEE